tara:strand:+ start:89 stop:244 length:156 start_codon:yes stop_codon:yes gene_type:complete
MSGMKDDTGIGDQISFKIIRGKDKPKMNLKDVKKKLKEIEEVLSILKGDDK